MSKTTLEASVTYALRRYGDMSVPDIRHKLLFHNMVPSDTTLEEVTTVLSSKVFQVSLVDLAKPLKKEAPRYPTANQIAKAPFYNDDVERGRGGRPKLLSAMSKVFELYGELHPEEIFQKLLEHKWAPMSKKPVDYIRFMLSKNRDVFEKVPGKRGKWRGAPPKPSQAEIDRLPLLERSVFDLHYGQGKGQQEIADTLGISLAAVDYRLTRLRAQLKFLKRYPGYLLLRESTLRRDLHQFGAKNLDILVHFWRTTCQSDTASHVGLKQSEVRYRLMKMIANLREEKSKYYRLFAGLFRQMGILRDTAKGQPKTQYLKSLMPWRAVTAR